MKVIRKPAIYDAIPFNEHNDFSKMTEKWGADFVRQVKYNKGSYSFHLNGQVVCLHDWVLKIDGSFHIFSRKEFAINFEVVHD